MNKFLLPIIAASRRRQVTAPEIELVIGWYNFDKGSTPEPPDFSIPGITGLVYKASASSTDGSTNGFYGNSDYASSSGNDGYVHVPARSTVTFSIENTTGGTLHLTGMLCNVTNLRTGDTLVFRVDGTLIEAIPPTDVGQPNDVYPGFYIPFTAAVASGGTLPTTFRRSVIAATTSVYLDNIGYLGYVTP